MNYRIQCYLKLFLLAISIGIGTTLKAQIIEVKSITCNGDKNGQLGVYPSYGTEPYTFLWSNGQTTQSIDGLSAATYTVTTTDILLSSKSFTYKLNEPAIVAAVLTTVSNTQWPVNDGSITIAASGGSGWYSYSLYDSTAQQTKNQPNPVYSNLASGIYHVTTSDLYGCKTTTIVTIGENSAGIPLTKAMIQSMVNVDTTACYRSTAPTTVKPDTSIFIHSVTIQFDNLAPFFYLDTTYRPKGPYVVPPIDTVGSFSGNFKPGFHMVTVSDLSGKGFRYSWTVDSILADISVTWTQTNITCFGGTGSISAHAQGSWNNMSYTIGGVAGSSRGGLVAGVYSIVATDYTGCSVAQSVTIKQPDQPLHIVFDAPTSATCTAATNGSASINRVDGSTGVVSYLWSNGLNTRSINSLKTNNYFVSVSDGNGCITNDSIFVGAGPGATGIVFDNPIHATCLNAKNGFARINRVDGAVYPVKYAWSNSITTINNDSLYTGLYNVTVTDINNCSINDSIFVPADNGIVGIVFDDPIKPTCIAAKNGKGKINRVDGAVKPLQYLWSNGIAKDEIDSIYSGKYFVTVIDKNNCSINDSIVVVAEKGIVGIVFDDPILPTCLTAKNGNGKINRVDGAVKPLQYHWSNGIALDEIDSVYTGKYFVTVTDKNNCSINDSINIELSKEPFQIFFDLPINARCPFSNDGLLSVHHIEGFTNPVKYLWSNAQTTTIIDSLSIGMYSITVTDINTCKQIDSIEVRTDKKACVFNVITPNNDGYNDYFDISDLCMGMNKKAEIFNENGTVIAKLDDSNPRWNGIDPSNPPNGPASTFTVFIEVYNNAGKLYKKWAETISVIYAK